MGSINKLVEVPVGNDPQEPRMTKEDYIYCEDCQMLVDFWKYDHNIEDAGHAECNWRYVTDDELAECIKDCEEAGCFEECIL